MDPLVLEVDPIKAHPLDPLQAFCAPPAETASWRLRATGSRSIAEWAISDKEAWTPRSVAGRPAFRLIFPPRAQQCGREATLPARAHAAPGSGG